MDQIVKRVGYRPADNPCYTAPELARLHGVNPRTVRRWVDTHDCPAPGPDGRIRLRDILKWWRERYSEAIRKRAMSAAERRLTALAKRAEFALALDEKRYAPVEDVERGNISRILATKAALLAWAQKLPPLLAGKSKSEIAAILKDETRHLLDILASGIPIPTELKKKMRAWLKKFGVDHD